MSRFLAFFGIAFTLLGGIHFYFWLRLVKHTQLPGPYRAWATAALVALALSLPLALLLGRQLPFAARGWVAWPAFIWMGLMFLLFVFLTGSELVRLFWLTGQAIKGHPLDPARRTLLARVLGVLAGGTAGLTGAFGIAQAVSSLHVKTVRVGLKRWPAALDGLRILQLTDVHFGTTIGRAFCERMVAMTNGENPDVIVITGDLVDGSVSDLRAAAAPLARLKARFGVFFVTGNHEYYSGVDEWMTELARLGVRVLRNEHVVLGDGDSRFVLAGIDDASAHRFGNGHGADLPKALAGRPASAPLVLLAHQPKAVREAEQLGVDLQISGHTHAGQIWPFSYLVRLDQPFVSGLNRTGDTQIYVSQGTGYWGPPLRLGTQAEITRIEVTSADT